MTPAGDLASDAARTDAARNNAALCDAVCRAHGINPRFDHDAWTSPRRTPPLYPDAVTLTADADPDAVLGRVDASPGCSIKDSFAVLPLEGRGFRVLFEAEWIVRRPRAVPFEPETSRLLEWRPIDDPAGLAAWEKVWRGNGPAGIFQPALLQGDLVFLAGYQAGQIMAGAIINHTDAVVGVSNVFARSGSLSRAWPGCIQAISERFPALPVVGYESGPALTAAIRHGFAPLGRLRVWVRDDA